MQLSLRIPKFFQKALVIFLGFTIFLTAIFLHQPVDAATQAYRHMAALGLVDGIVTPQEIGLDYLSQPPAKVADLNELLKVIKLVNQGAENISNENMPLTVDLCNNQPVSTNEPERNQVCNSSEANNSQAVGLIDNAGQPKAITPKVVKDMTSTEYGNRGDLEVVPMGQSLQVKAQNILLADASGSFLQARRIPSFTLIVRNKQTQKLKVVKGVNANSFCRDVLNSFIRGRVRKLATNSINIT